MGLIMPFPCNSIGFSTNKIENHPNIKLDTKKIAYKYPDLGIIVLKPVIDRIVFGFQLTEELVHQYDPAQDFEEYKKHIQSSAWFDAKTGHEHLSPIDDIPLFKAPFNKYKTNLYLKLPDCAPIIINLFPKSQGTPFVRMDFQPSKISQQGMKKFITFVEEMFMFEAFGLFPFPDFLKNCQITNLDIAADILGARPFDLEIKTMAGKKAKPSKTSEYKSMSGRVETIYLDTKAGKPNTKYLYDRKKDQEEKGFSPEYGDFYHARYEARFGKTKFYILENKKNPFNKVFVKALKLAEFMKRDYVDQLFIRYALSRTLLKALEIVPDNLQAQYTNTYTDLMEVIWKPEQIWKFWPETLKSHQLWIEQQKL